jgi:hypothetical protein
VLWWTGRAIHSRINSVSPRSNSQPRPRPNCHVMSKETHLGLLYASPSRSSADTRVGINSEDCPRKKGICEVGLPGACEVLGNVYILFLLSNHRFRSHTKFQPFVPHPPDHFLRRSVIVDNITRPSGSCPNDRNPPTSKSIHSTLQDKNSDS